MVDPRKEDATIVADVQERKEERKEGRRATKRRETHARIVGAAMELFLDRGFAAVTIDEIAEAADVSKRSFFDYFPTKEDVVEGWHDTFGDELTAEIAGRPEDEPPFLAIERAMSTAISRSATDRSIALDRLIRGTPTLNARNQLKYVKLETRVADALAARSNGETFQSRLIAIIVIGLLRWSATRIGGPDHVDVDRVQIDAITAATFDRLWQEIRTMSAMIDDRQTLSPPRHRA